MKKRSSKNSKLLVTVGEAAELLSLGRSLTYQLIMAGQIRSILIGRSRRVPVASLADCVREQLETQVDA